MGKSGIVFEPTSFITMDKKAIESGAAENRSVFNLKLSIKIHNLEEPLQTPLYIYGGTSPDRLKFLVAAIHRFEMCGGDKPNIITTYGDFIPEFIYQGHQMAKGIMPEDQNPKLLSVIRLFSQGKCDSMDVLVVENVESVLRGDEETQNKFFAGMFAMTAANKQVILSSPFAPEHFEVTISEYRTWLSQCTVVEILSHEDNTE